MKNTTQKPVEIDLSGLNLEEIDVFLQESGRAVPELSASSASGCQCRKGQQGCCLSCTKRAIQIEDE
ncbi:MAG TPA: hypothetical protein VG649_11185 [Candidatus Angelobacter sp.]|nr:hypothetical protein [Candidatus Angelobacter sp.]